MRFTGRVLFATGAGSGLAAATASRYAAEGGRVAIADLDLGRAEALAAQLPGSIALGCDVSEEASVAKAVAETHRQLGRIDGVLNAAGHAIFGSIEETSVAAWNRIFAVHVTGTFLVCRATMPILREGGGGSIVNLASISALMGRPKQGAYAAAKGAILAFSRQLATDVAADKVRVNVVAPGTVKTAMTIPLFDERGEGDRARGEAMSSEAIPLKRVGLPEEIAAPICFLLSDEASFFTGTVLVPDGGMTAI